MRILKKKAENLRVTYNLCNDSTINMYAVHAYFYYLKTSASCSISAALGRCSRSTPKINLRNSFVSSVAWEGKCFPGMTDLCPCWPPPCQVSTVKRRCVTLRQISKISDSHFHILVHILFPRGRRKKTRHCYTCRHKPQTSTTINLTNHRFQKLTLLETAFYVSRDTGHSMLCI